jgi:hypothetical protein
VACCGIIGYADCCRGGYGGNWQVAGRRIAGVIRNSIGLQFSSVTTVLAQAAGIIVQEVQVQKIKYSRLLVPIG